MKIAISSTGPDLDSEVDPRFGRCQYFMIVDPDDMSFEAVPNANLTQGGGVGIQSAKAVADKGAKAVLTGNVGPNAHQVLSEAGLDVITGVSGTVREAAQQYKNGQLHPTNKPNAENHAGTQAYVNQPPSPSPQQVPGIGFGTGGGMGMGRGMGGGRGMGRGARCGRGMGGGRGMGMGRGLQDSPPMASGSKSTRKEELSYLKEDAETLREQMEEIQRRIKELETQA